MRTVQVHPSKSIRFTKHAEFWCTMINAYKKCYPTHSFKTIAQHFGLTEVNTRRYYYGIHHCNSGDYFKGTYQCFTQMRQGACVPL